MGLTRRILNNQSELSSEPRFLRKKHELLGTSWPEKNSSNLEGYERWHSLVLKSKNGIELHQSPTLALSNWKRSTIMSYKTRVA